MARGLTGFQGKLLAELRVLRDMDQVKLAKNLGRDQSTISAWENGKQLPEAAAVARLAALLSVGQNYFFHAVPAEGRTHYFRDVSRNLQKVRKFAISRLRWLEIITGLVEDWIELPNVHLPTTYRNIHYKEITDEMIESAASECRNLWGLGDAPVANIVDVIERAGIVLAKESVSANTLDGLSVWSQGSNRPFIFLTADKGSCVRSRFDAAHELGHLVLHKELTEEEFNSDWNFVERQAHRFASAFLMPEASFAASVQDYTLDGLLSLKPRWKASVSAIVMRCADLELIPPEYKTRLFKQLSMRGWRKSEPFDDLWKMESPTLISEAIALLLDSGTVSGQALIDMSGLPPRDFESLAGLSAGLLTSEHANRNAKVTLKSSAENVVHLGERRTK